MNPGLNLIPNSFCPVSVCLSLFVPGVRVRSQNIMYDGLSEDDIDDSHDALAEADDSFYDTDEDSFNVTLRTPVQSRRQHATHSVPMGSRAISITTQATINSSTSSGESDYGLSEVTGLSTIRHAPFYPFLLVL